VPHVEGSEHPRELGPAESPVGLVLAEVGEVVPVDEAIVEGGQKGEECQDGKGGGDREVPQPVDFFRGDRPEPGAAEAGGRRRVSAAAGLSSVWPRDLSVSRRN
jgi:hypothetical protein